MLNAMIMGGTLGCHGAILQPMTQTNALPDIPQPLPVPAVFPVAPPPAKRMKLGDGPWQHAGLMREYGGVKQYLRMKRGEIPWPPQDSLS